MGDQHSPEKEKCVELTVRVTPIFPWRILMPIANMDDFLSRWKTLHYSKKAILNGV